MSRERARRREVRAAAQVAQAAERQRRDQRRAKRNVRIAKREAARAKAASPARATYRLLRPIGRAFRRRSKTGRVILLGLVVFVVATWAWSDSGELTLAAAGVAVLAAPVLLTIFDTHNR